MFGCGWLLPVKEIAVDAKAVVAGMLPYMLTGVLPEFWAMPWARKRLVPGKGAFPAAFTAFTIWL